VFRIKHLLTLLRAVHPESITKISLSFRKQVPPTKLTVFLLVVVVATARCFCRVLVSGSFRGIRTNGTWPRPSGPHTRCWFFSRTKVTRGSIYPLIHSPHEIRTSREILVIAPRTGTCISRAAHYYGRSTFLTHTNSTNYDTQNKKGTFHSAHWQKCLTPFSKALHRHCQWSISFVRSAFSYTYRVNARREWMHLSEVIRSWSHMA
jgi:hypothetical protein